MGTNKPKVQIILEPECYKKYKKLCERDDRTESKLGKRIIEKYIEDYESIHGEIKIDDLNEK